MNVDRKTHRCIQAKRLWQQTVFLLALQSTKPSPFYLMDEVDAHLDARSKERLSKIMVDRSEGSQILMVTLKGSTVAKASQIFEIYPKSGASKYSLQKSRQNTSRADKSNRIIHKSFSVY